MKKGIPINCDDQVVIIAYQLITGGILLGTTYGRLLQIPA